MDILWLFYQQNTTRTNPIIIQSVIFYDALPNHLKILSIHFQLSFLH